MDVNFGAGGAFCQPFGANDPSKKPICTILSDFGPPVGAHVGAVLAGSILASKSNLKTDRVLEAIYD